MKHKWNPITDEMRNDYTTNGHVHNKFPAIEEIVWITYRYYDNSLEVIPAYIDSSWTYDGINYKWFCMWGDEEITSIGDSAVVAWTELNAPEPYKGGNK